MNISGRSITDECDDMCDGQILNVAYVELLNVAYVLRQGVFYTPPPCVGP